MKSILERRKKYVLTLVSISRLESKGGHVYLA